MKRYFGSELDSHGIIFYDPLSGLTHYSQGIFLSTGRLLIEESEVTKCPTVHPGSLGRLAPISICWSPIVLCNLHCPHCLDDKSLNETNGSDRAVVAELIAKSGIMGVDISGGEPLLLEDLPSLSQELISGGLVVSITTNGWWLKKNVPRLLGAVDALRVSLDGPDEVSHDRLRGGGSFARALEGLRCAIESGLPVQVQTVAMTSTVQRLQELLELSAVEGASGVTILQFLPIGEGRHIADQEVLSDERALEIYNTLRIPPKLKVRLRLRQDAGDFTVVRADRSIWRNSRSALSIQKKTSLYAVSDLNIEERDGSA